MAGRKKQVGPVNYYELSRKQLQSLCKKYGFPANKTNQLMAEFLTAHLNSEEYLNRDRSLPSPAVKTMIHVPDEEAIDSQVTTENSLPSISESQPTISELQPTISESQPTISGMQARNLCSVFVNDDAAQVERTPVSSEKEEERVGEEITLQEAAGLGPSEGSKNSTIAGSGARDSSPQSPRGSGQEVALSFPISEQSMDFPVARSKTQDSPLESGQESPLPLSVMPYVCLFSPEVHASYEEVKLVVDLRNDSLPKLARENLGIYGGTTRECCQAWESSRSWITDKTQDDNIFGSFKSLKGSEKSWLPKESQPDSGLERNWMDRSPQDVEMQNELSQAVPASITSSRETVAPPLKSSLFTPKLKSSLKVSFACPDVFPSPVNINWSGIVEEWSVDKNQETPEPIDEGPNSSDDGKALVDGLVLRELDANAVTEDTLEIDTRKQQCAAAMESPDEVKIYEEGRQTRGPYSITRKYSYKNSPFLRSSRVAAELERASKSGRARRVGILGLKRSLGVVPMFSEPEDVEKTYRDDVSSCPVTASPPGELVMSDGVPSDTTFETSHGALVKNDSRSEMVILPGENANAAISAVSSSASEPLVGASGELGIQSVSMEVTRPPIEGPSEDKRMLVGGETGTCSREEHEVIMTDKAPHLPATVVLVTADAISDTVMPSENTVAAMAVVSSSAAEPLVVASREFGSESMSSEFITSPFEVPAEEELLVFGSETGTSTREEHEMVMVDKVSQPATVEESATNLSWMTKPIQVPTRRPMNHKSKEKAWRPLSANGRKFELMERAAAGKVAKLKASKKSTAARDGVATCRSKNSNATYAEEMNIRVCAQTDEVGEVTMIPRFEERPTPEIVLLGMSDPRKIADDIPPRRGLSPLEGSVFTASSERSVAEKCTENLSQTDSNLSGAGDTIVESFSAAANVVATMEEINNQGRPDSTDLLLGREGLDAHVLCDVTKTIKENSDEKSNSASSLLNVNLLQNREKKAEGMSPAQNVLGLLDIDFTKVREKPTALSPIDSNRWGSDTVIESSPNPCTPYKASGILLVQDVLGESEGKENNGSGLVMHGKENEWMKRQDQHKPSLTGRSKEKALRTAEKKASNLREQLLRKRRGMEQTIDDSDAPVSPSIQLSPHKQLTTTRLL